MYASVALNNYDIKLSILQSIQKLQKISFALHLLKAITVVAGKDPLVSLGVKPALSLFGA